MYKKPLISSEYTPLGGVRPGCLMTGRGELSKQPNRTPIFFKNVFFFRSPKRRRHAVTSRKAFMLVRGAPGSII